MEKGFETDFSFPELGNNSNLYAFLATQYDISDLAGKIYASNSSKFNIISLKKVGNLVI